MEMSSHLPVQALPLQKAQDSTYVLSSLLLERLSSVPKRLFKPHPLNRILNSRMTDFMTKALAT